MHESLAKPIHNRLPHITVISYSTIVEDDAAIVFANGFYEYIGKELEAGRIPCITDAYKAATDEWNGHGKIWGDPRDAVPSGGQRAHGRYEILTGVPRLDCT